MLNLYNKKRCYSTKIQPEKLQIQLTHFKQKSNWDCGVSCVLMVLPKVKREEFLNNFSQICKSEGFNKSTWTIDLCYLLKKFQVPHIFYTITLGVHEGYRENSFYNTILSKDEHRINARFKEAENVGIVVRKQSVSMLEIISHLTNGPVIVLTNAKILSCDICKFNKISREFRKCIPWPAPYQGHYVVLCGFDIHNEKLFYRNPSFNDHVCVIPMEIFDLARKSYGTDEDIIFTYT
ncbi:protein GUCD1 isoform X1 [Diorhabda carinulata]|uniref:protein GUCD1 isoform X2 n=2 Tax=Diorhabda TaxID=217246 RepID=UPI0024E0D609|nr:protein GUCD1 isoform X2 [Diorhabda sublineata]XP_057654202.1 protein GUCD1 isoform X1 [Diorhabda carinulata]